MAHPIPRRGPAEEHKVARPHVVGPNILAPGPKRHRRAWHLNPHHVPVHQPRQPRAIHPRPTHPADPVRHPKPPRTAHPPVRRRRSLPGRHRPPARHRPQLRRAPCPRHLNPGRFKRPRRSIRKPRARPGPAPGRTTRAPCRKANHAENLPSLPHVLAPIPRHPLFPQRLGRRERPESRWHLRIRRRSGRPVRQPRAGPRVPAAPSGPASRRRRRHHQNGRNANRQTRALSFHGRGRYNAWAFGSNRRRFSTRCWSVGCVLRNHAVSPPRARL